MRGTSHSHGRSVGIANHLPNSKFAQEKESCFLPFKSVVSVQREDTPTVFWECHPCSEGIDTTKEDLLCLRRRVETTEGEGPRVARVDSCCSVQAKLKELLGDHILALLEAFHWFVCWDKILSDDNSAEATLF